MESLLSAYASQSDEDDHSCMPKPEEATQYSAPKRFKLVASSLPRVPPQSMQNLPDFGLHPQVEIQQGTEAAPGRYISKRERAAMAHLGSEQAEPSASHQPSGIHNIMDSDLPIHIQRRLDQARDRILRNHLPKGVIAQLKGHNKGVNCVRWSPTHGSLLASAGMDHVVCIWKLWTKGMEQPACRVSCHTAAVKDAQWSSQGTFLLTCSFDKTSRLTDVETNHEKQVFEEDQVVNAVRFHPFEIDLFLSGGSKGALRLWDIRSGKVVREYFKSLGQIMDVDFSKDGRRFVSTSDIAKRNSSDKTIVVWDYHNQIPLSNQVYMEPYTCPSVRFHPHEDSFIAQSNAGYIAVFSARPPFKLNKLKRFEGHEVSGFRVQCNFSPDGEYVLTGSADGCIYFYHYRSCNCLKKIKMHEVTCTDVAYHPRLATVVASCSWDGTVCVYE